MKNTILAFILATSFFSGCGDSDESSAPWEVVSVSGDQRQVISTFRANLETIPENTRDQIRNRTNVAQDMVSAQISLVRRVQSGHTETIGPMWIEQNGETYDLMIRGIASAAPGPESPLAEGFRRVSTAREFMVNEFDRILRESAENQQGQQVEAPDAE